MYNINEFIVYGKTGICKIKDITTPEHISQTDQLFYVLQPLEDSCLIYAPVDTKTFMRPVISSEEANHLIEKIPRIKPQSFQDKSLKDIAKYYESVIENHDCEDLVQLVVSIYEKKKLTKEKGLKLGQLDEKTFKQAESFLESEFSIALGIEKEKVPEYIAEKINSSS
jgi:CarD family transcriptional regulator